MFSLSFPSGDLSSYYKLYPPYESQCALENECPCFPGKGEIEVYKEHLMAGLWFPIDPDLLTILDCDLSLYRYTPASIGCMVGFLSHLPKNGLLFCLELFHYFFKV